jgi:hypothetical protein
MVNESSLSPEIGTDSNDWAKLSRFYMKTETELSPKRYVLIKNRMMVNGSSLPPEIRTGSIDSAQLSSFYMKTEIESSLRKVVCSK